MLRYSLAESVSLACLLEATAPKPGNVHRGADFDDLTFQDLAISGIVIGARLERAAEIGVGQAAWEAISATRAVVATNSNLGIVLLLAPLAAVSRTIRLEAGIANVLAQLTSHDAALLWQTIQTAQAGGLGKVEEQDLAGPPPADIRAAMKLAADRDLIAAQYANGFRELFEFVVPWLLEACNQGSTLTEAIIHTHLRLMATFPDTLIARKAGLATAQQAAEFAGQVLRARDLGNEAYHAALSDFDFWLRSAGRQRNPGTTADLLAAGLFVLLREERIEPPYR